MATTNPIDQYLATLDEPKRATLTSVRNTIMTIVPEAEQCISYGMPAFKLRGKTIAGFAAFKNHLSYLPHSGSVIPQLAKETKAARRAATADGRDAQNRKIWRKIHSISVGPSSRKYSAICRRAYGASPWRLSPWVTNRNCG